MISIVIPAYQEEGRIGSTLRAIAGTVSPAMFGSIPGSSRSAPEQKPWPAPVSTTIRRASSIQPRTAAIAGAYVRADGWTVVEGALNASYTAHVSIRARNVGAGASAGRARPMRLCQ